MIVWIALLAVCVVAILVLVVVVLINTDKLLSKTNQKMSQVTRGVLSGQGVAHSLKAVDEFPQFTSVFPVHWSGFPVENSEPGKQVVLPGAFGVGSKEEYKWIETWMLMDTALSEPRPGPLPHLVHLNVDQVLAGVEAYQLKSQVEGAGVVVSSAVMADNLVIHIQT